MWKTKALYHIAIAEGIILLIAGFIRAISINNLVIGISTGDISKHYGASILFDWGLAAFLLGLTGVWLLFLARDLREYRLRAWWQAFILSLSISVFSGFYWYHFPYSRRLPVFLALGLLLLIPVTAQANKFKKTDR